MSEELVIDGKTYVSSKRASEISGYAQDYIGQLARASLIDSHRIGGLWFIFMESLLAYKEKATAVVPKAPTQYAPKPDSDALVTFDGKDYVSASRAAQMTGYHQDYVGQLARTGKILSRQIGNRWYVDRDGIMTHKEEKDHLLAAVQTQSVGLMRPQDRKIGPTADHAPTEPFYSYANQERPLMPQIEAKEHDQSEIVRGETRQLEVINIEKVLEEEPTDTPTSGTYIELRSVPVKINRLSTEAATHGISTRKGGFTTKKWFIYGTPAGAAFLVIVLLFGAYHALSGRKGGITEQNTEKKSSLAAAVGAVGDFLEPLFTKELVYSRKKSPN